MSLQAVNQSVVQSIDECDAINQSTGGVQRSIERQSHVYHEQRIALERKWRSRHFRLPKSKVSGRPRKASSDCLIIQLVRADSTLSLTEMTKVVYSSVPPSTVRRRLLELNVRNMKRPNAVELTDQHVCARLIWVMRHCHWRHQWRPVVWFDDISI